MKLRVLVVDDEDLARLRLKGLLLDCRDADGEPLAHVVAEAASAAAARDSLRDVGADLVLLDVQMPGTDGLALAAQIKFMEPPPAVVFVTAHAQHAVRAFELEAVDYLTKPVRRERLQAALERVLVRRKEASAAAEQAIKGGEAGADTLVVNDRGRVARVPMDDVLYLKAELKYVTLRTREHTHVLDESLTELEQRLGDRVLRIHRNALVARHAVRALEKRTLLDADEVGETWAVRVAPTDEWLAVSRRQVSAVREALMQGA